MSPPKKPSGAEFRRRAKLKSDASKKYYGKIKNWLSKEDMSENKTDNCFSLIPHCSTPSTSSASSQMEFFTLGTETEPGTLEFKSKSQEDTESPSDSVEKSTPLQKSPKREPEAFCFDPDPANWVVNNELRDYVSQYGLIQNKEADFSKAKKEYGNRSWSFSSTHFYRHLANGEKQNRAWLVYSETKRAVFCGPCRLFHSETQPESSFMKCGFSDWKNVTSRLKEHENSVSHKNNTITLKERGEKLGKVNSQLTEMIDREINYWQMLLQRVVVVIKALASRGLPFRGSNEVFGSSSNGNYMMLLEVLAEFDPFLSEHIRKYGNPGKGHISYLSSTICDEFIELLGKQVTNYILEEAKCSQYFSLIIDSTPDISHVDQLSFVIRYVKQNGEPVERFMKFLPHIGHKALDMFNAVTETLKLYGLDIQKCRGQSYDNASNMSGIYSGLQARVLEITPLASYVPCAGHSLNLVGTHAVESCIEAVSLFTLVQELYNFFSSSTHRWAVLTKHKTTILTTKSLSTTRWSARHDALRALQEEWPAIIRALEALQNDTGQKSSTRAEARGLLSRLNRLETAIMAKLWGTILSRLHKVNKYVQNEDIDAMAVVQAFKSLISFFDELRNQFDMYENKALDVCENKVYEYDQRRRTIRKLKDGESQDGEVSFSGRDNFRVNTFLPIIDKIKQQLIMRMNSYEEFVGKFGVIIKLMDLTTEKLENEVKKILTVFKNDLEPSICDELIHLKSHLTANKIENKNPSSLYKWLIGNNLQDVYPNVEILLRMFICTPVTNASAER
nr:unnamed protein product [Callosobruchus chinensis]